MALAFFVFAFLRRKALLATLSSPLPMRRSFLVRPAARRWRATLVLLGLALTAVAVAGPQWGFDQSAQFRKGRDVIVVLDLSRSMFAEQPSRRDFALGALKHLAETFESQGGNRVALVGFASQPRLFFPFTQDCNHFRHTLNEIKNNDYPKLNEKDAVSGTRIGAALAFALASCDSEKIERPVIVLLSDGDDPVEDDEWRTGVDQARERKVPIYVVGVGNPAKAETIAVAGDLLEFEGEIVRSKINEARLRKIAESTGGAYWPAHRQEIPLGLFLINALEIDEMQAPASARLPVYQLRYSWFLFPAAMLLLTAMLIGDGRRASRRKCVPLGLSKKAPAFAMIAAAIFSISAADPPPMHFLPFVGVGEREPPAIETLLRQADDAFAADNFELALNLYEKAEVLTQDPGRLSFNKAAAFYRLQRYREAIESYRRCLEDDASPSERRTRAWFQLGNSLVQQADGDVGQLADAVDAYRKVLQFTDEKSPIRADAKYNLELAQSLLIKAREKQQDNKMIPKVKPDKTKNDSEGKGSKEQKFVLVPADGAKGEKSKDAANSSPGKQSDQLQTGAIYVLPDSDKIAPRSSEQALADLAAQVTRIRDERRRQQHPPQPAQLTTKDW